MTETNGSSGRFERMEAKLDILISDLNSFKLDAVTRLTRLETAQGESAEVKRDKATASNLFWIKVGTVAAILLGGGGFLLRLLT